MHSGIKNAVTIQEIQLNLEAFLPFYCNFVTGRGVLNIVRVNERI